MSDSRSGFGSKGRAGAKPDCWFVCTYVCIICCVYPVACGPNRAGHGNCWLFSVRCTQILSPLGSPPQILAVPCRRGGAPLSLPARAAERGEGRRNRAWRPWRSKKAVRDLGMSTPFCISLIRVPKPRNLQRDSGEFASRSGLKVPRIRDEALFGAFWPFDGL